MNLTPNQQKALNIDRHICVTAGAGSGKTTVLVGRYLEILQQANVTPEQVVAITFTDKAAAEMKGRIIEELSHPQHAEIRRRHIEQMNTAPISTIHSFCANILREFPFQAGVPANFSIVQGIDQKLLLNQTIQENLQDIATNPQHKLYKKLRHALQRYGNREKLFDLFSTLIEKRDIVDSLIESVYTGGNDGEIPAVWQTLFLDVLPSETDINEFLQSLSAVGQVATGRRSPAVNELASTLAALPDRNPKSPEVRNLLDQIAKLITTSSNGIAKRDFLGSGVDVSELQDEIETLVSVATQVKSAPPMDNGETKTDDGETDDLFLFKTTKKLLSLYRGIRNDYQNNKLAQGKLDFTDLQLMTLDLLKSNDAIRNKLVERHKYFMIDEYQDTNEVQCELIMLLTNHLQDANVFIVGDPKQSIFGFRGADVRIFDKTRMEIEENDGETIQLKENFRSLRELVAFVNHFFERLMGDGTQSEYDVPFEALTKARLDNEDGIVEILLGNGGDTPESEYELIANRVKCMVTDGINYEDIAILIRSRTHLPDLEAALIAKGIPYLTTGGIGFYQRQEIYDIWNYLHFLSDPAQNHTSLVGILRGPAFGISDTELYEISLHTDNSFWEKAKSFQTPSTQLQRAIAIIENQIQWTHRLPVNQLIHNIVHETGLIATLNLGKQGQQRYANYQKLLDLARHYDSEENKQTLSEFIAFLDILITDEPREGQAPIENTSGSVEIMTVHSSKGKQFPVVILPCLHRKGANTTEPFIDEKGGIGFRPLNPEDGYAKAEPEIVNTLKTRANEKDTAEKKRLFYVAATRAKDKLILSGALDRYGKARDLLEWLFEHLGINPNDECVTIDVDIDEYANQTTQRHHVHLHIPIIRSIDPTSCADEHAQADNPIAFPEPPIHAGQQGVIGKSYSVIELANYARCPLRYQLEHVLRIPPLEIRNDEPLDTVVRYMLLRIHSDHDGRSLEDLIERALENFTDTQLTLSPVQRETILEHILNYQQSQVAKMIHASANIENNRAIHANINGQILSCNIDKKIEDPSGNWHAINFKTNTLHAAEYYEPEMELIGLLLHKTYPDQNSVTVYYYNTQQNACHTRTYTPSQLEEISNKYHEKIASLQQEIYTKDLGHCPSCQYSDRQDHCIVNLGRLEQ